MSNSYKSLSRLNIISTQLQANDLLFIKQRIQIKDDVRKALKNNDAVVALESTIISHGMEYPQNVKTALSLEDIVRGNGAVPATIAIIDGVIKIGLELADIEKLGKIGKDCRKCSRRDLAFVLAKNETGSTTVAATMYLAYLAGIKIFVTGGIGGVHRGAESTFDISADLTELSRTPVTVISAGVKSILDIPKTLEVLETLGVPVISYGTDYFPDFFTPSSGIKTVQRANDPEECASIIKAATELKMRNGMIISVPIPKEKAADSDLIKRSIDQALEECNKNGIQGYEVTPFLLKRVNEITGGESSKSNVELIKNNARLGSQIALSLSKMIKEEESSFSSDPYSQSSTQTKNSTTPRVVIVGGSSVDVLGKTNEEATPHNSNVGQIDVKCGGTSRNVAECLSRLSMNDSLVLTSVGKDMFGKLLLENFDELNLSKSGIYVSDTNRTAIFSGVINQRGEFVTGVADMKIHEDLPIKHVEKYKESILSAKILLLDANLSSETISYVCDLATETQTIIFEPISKQKCKKLFEHKILSKITILKPNLDQLLYIANEIRTHLKMPPITTISDLPTIFTIIHEIFIHSKFLNNYTRLKHIVVTMGERGVVWSYFDRSRVTINHNQFSARDIDQKKIVSANGAGDSFVGGLIYGLANNYKFGKSIGFGLKCAEYSLYSKNNICEDLNESVLLKNGNA